MHSCGPFRNSNLLALAMAVKLSPLSVITPALYLTLGYLSLAYFKVAYGLFTRLVNLHLGIPRTYGWLPRNDDIHR